MANDKILLGVSVISSFVAFLLFLFIGVIFWAIYIHDGLISLGFLLLYTVYLLYMLLVFIGTLSHSGFFKPKEEDDEMTKLKMTNARVFSLLLFGLSLPIVLNLDHLKGSKWHFFLLGLAILLISIIWMYKGYTLRYLKLIKKFESKK